MNPLFHAASDSARLGILMGATTVLFLAVTLGWAAWAWWPSRRAQMERYGRLPLDTFDDGDAR